MGAWFAEQVAAGRTPAEAYGRALEAAREEFGHQDGYSGAINSKAQGFSLYELPARLTYRKLVLLATEYEDAEGELEEARSDLGFYVENGKPKRGYAKRVAKARTAEKRAKAKIERLENRYPALDLEQVVRQMNDKWESPVCVELKGAERKSFSRIPRRRGERLYIFFGYAPS